MTIESQSLIFYNENMQTMLCLYPVIGLYRVFNVPGICMIHRSIGLIRVIKIIIEEKFDHKYIR